jgi:hypothetical protein
MDRHCVIPCLKSQDLVYMILADLQRELRMVRTVCLNVVR